MYDFHSKVFLRILCGRISSEQWQAETPIIPSAIAHLRCFKPEVLRSAMKSEDFAYDIFNTDFRRLSFEWQRRVSGRSLAEWLDDERAYRGAIPAVCATCHGTGILGAADCGNDAPEGSRRHRGNGASKIIP